MNKQKRVKLVAVNVFCVCRPRWLTLLLNLGLKVDVVPYLVYVLVSNGRSSPTGSQCASSQTSYLPMVTNAHAHNLEAIEKVDRAIKIQSGNSWFPWLRHLNTTTRILCGFFIFMQTLNSQSKWIDNCSRRHSGSCIQQMYQGNWPLMFWLKRPIQSNRKNIRSIPVWSSGTFSQNLGFKNISVSSVGLINWKFPWRNPRFT